MGGRGRPPDGAEGPPGGNFLGGNNFFLKKHISLIFLG